MDTLERLDNHIKTLQDIHARCRAMFDVMNAEEILKDILEKEKAVMSHIDLLEKQRIVQIVGTYNLTGDDLKKKLAAILPANSPKTSAVFAKPVNERTNENEKND